MMRKKPMLAYPVSDKPIDYNKPTFIQPKLDGVRCLIQAEFTDVKTPFKVKAYSRTGKEWKNIDHILEEFEECAEIKKEIDIINDKLSNL